MIAMAIRLEISMPAMVSIRMRDKAALAWRGASSSGLVAALLIHFLHFLGALPEEKIGADGGAEDRDDGGGGALRQVGMQADQAQADGAPVEMDHEHQRDIGEQRKVRTVRKRA